MLDRFEGKWVFDIADPGGHPGDVCWTFAWSPTVAMQTGVRGATSTARRAEQPSTPAGAIYGAGSSCPEGEVTPQPLTGRPRLSEQWLFFTVDVSYASGLSIAPPSRRPCRRGRVCLARALAPAAAPRAGPDLAQALPLGRSGLKSDGPDDR